MAAVVFAFGSRPELSEEDALNLDSLLVQRRTAS
jgi:hypothetical protein